MVSKVEKTGNPGKPKGLPKSGGRKKGTPNKATADLKAIASEYTAEAVEALVGVIRSTESDAARVSAIKELFDRAHGKATQSVDLTGEMSFVGLDVTIKR